jgi:hypothetical protein
VVLSFSFAKATELSGIDTSIGYDWDSRLAMDLWFLDYLDEPETFISEIKHFYLDPGVAPTEWARPGVDPLKLLELW